MKDITASLRATPLWALLGWYDVRQKYRRSILGPFWLTISTGIMVVALGILYSTLFKLPIQEYIPHFAVGYVIWIFISSQLTEACTTFTQFDSIIKQIANPPPIYILRVLWRNLITLAHNLVIVFIVVTFVGTGWHAIAPLSILGLALVTAFLFFVSIPLAMLCTRFRDLTQIVGVAVQILFFFTPVMWNTKSLPREHAWIADFNPFYHLLDIVRAPLLGEPPQATSWLWAVGAVIVAAWLATTMLSRFRHRIAYWL
jgi:ABC-type polysaccharide/polyol phosphate export permease